MISGAVKNEKQYKECLNRIDYLMQSDPEPASEPGQELETLVSLVEDYESEQFKFSLPGMIDTVLFRIQETVLRQKNSTVVSERSLNKSHPKELGRGNGAVQRQRGH